MKIYKKIILILILIFNIFSISCTIDFIDPTEDNNEIVAGFEDVESTIYVGNVINLNSIVGNTFVNYTSSNEEVIYIYKMGSVRAIAKSVGEAIIYAYSKVDNTLISEYLISVINNKVEEISIINSQSKINAGETISLKAEIEPKEANQEVVWKSLDESIGTVDENGNFTGVSNGVVTIVATSQEDETKFAETTIWVSGNVEAGDYVNNTVIVTNGKYDTSSLTGIVKPIIEKTISCVIGVNGYGSIRVNTLTNTGSGVVYKRFLVLENGEEVVDDGTYEGDFVNYKYYAITNKHLIYRMAKVSIYYKDYLGEMKEIPAEVVACDAKVDIGVISFSSKKYFSIGSFGDSNECQTGEFVLAIGNTYGEQYYQSSSLGIISYNSRYVGDDTDGDEINDWDALYIQHDVAISEGSSGGPLVNMKGEIIAINTLKINDSKIDNMAFSIPSNLVIELASLLEQGIVPERPLLLISVTSVKDILKNGFLQAQYNIPEGITYGMYVAEITVGGVGSKAGMQIGDIIVEFNGNKTEFSYELRAAIGECIIGSGEEAIIKVYRNGELITLKAVF